MSFGELPYKGSAVARIWSWILGSCFLIRRINFLCQTFWWILQSAGIFTTEFFLGKTAADLCLQSERGKFSFSQLFSISFIPSQFPQDYTTIYILFPLTDLGFLVVRDPSGKEGGAGISEELSTWVILYFQWSSHLQACAINFYFLLLLV
jgi:hypothetical protein